MDLDILSKYNQWNSELEEKYLKLWPEAEYHIWDGVISPNDYFRSPLKILFLNKEAYDTEYDSYDISEALKDELELGKPIFNNRPIKYNFKNRLFVLNLISNLNQSYLTDDVYNQYSNEEFYHDMLKTAYCNIKKSDGKGKSNSLDLRYCFLRNKEIIEEQISFLNPSLIIGGNVVDGIIEDSFNWGENLYVSESNVISIYQLVIKGRTYPFFDMYHPAKAINHSIERIELFKALKFVNEKYPMFWKNRCNNACFID